MIDVEGTLSPFI